MFWIPWFSGFLVGFGVYGMIISFARWCEREGKTR